MPDKDELPVWKPEPVKLIERPEPDEEEELQALLAAIEAAKDDDTELITSSQSDRS
jgi:hypothetical protein